MASATQVFHTAELVVTGLAEVALDHWAQVVGSAFLVVVVVEDQSAQVLLDETLAELELLEAQAFQSSRG